MKKYDLVTHVSLDAFVRLVNQKLNEGWICLGGITKIETSERYKFSDGSRFDDTRDRYAQAILWEEEDYTQTTQSAKPHIVNVTQTDQDKLAA